MCVCVCVYIYIPSPDDSGGATFQVSLDEPCQSRLDTFRALRTCACRAGTPVRRFQHTNKTQMHKHTQRDTNTRTHTDILGLAAAVMGLNHHHLNPTLHPKWTTAPRSSRLAAETPPPHPPHYILAKPHRGEAAAGSRISNAHAETETETERQCRRET